MKKLVAVSACTTGVAHTFMAAEALTKAAKEMGYEIKVETQGAAGIENKITAEDIAEAVGCIWAVDVGVTEAERFDALPTLECSTKEAIKKANKILKELEGYLG
jgi:fructose-specific phosphotransferase system IIB component